MSFISNLLSKRISAWYAVVLAVLAFGISYYFINRHSGKEHEMAAVKPCPDSMNQLRLKKYTYTRPLLLTDVTESQVLNPIKDQLVRYLADQKEQGSIEDYSVYFRKMDGGLWFAINPNTPFKVAVVPRLASMLYLLRNESYSKGFLKSAVKLNAATYTYDQLLDMMIVNGNRDAEKCIMDHIQLADYNEMLTDLNINTDVETVIDISKLLRVIYNGTFLPNNDLSENALRRLAANVEKSTIRSGIGVQLPVAILPNDEVKNELTEVAIVYYPDNPYMLCVKLKGNATDKMKLVLKEISAMCYEGYKAVNS